MLEEEVRPDGPLPLVQVEHEVTLLHLLVGRQSLEQGLGLGVVQWQRLHVVLEGGVLVVGLRVRVAAQAQGTGSRGGHSVLVLEGTEERLHIEAISEEGLVVGLLVGEGSVDLRVAGKVVQTD